MFYRLDDFKQIAAKGVRRQHEATRTLTDTEDPDAFAGAAKGVKAEIEEYREGLQRRYEKANTAIIVACQRIAHRYELDRLVRSHLDISMAVRRVL